MKVIVGLGNPGKRYTLTRHNAGFWVIDHLSERWNIPLNSGKFQSIFGEGHFNGEKVILVKPQTYMNLSGQSIQAIIKFWKIPTSNLLVIFDDLDLPPGMLRLKQKGSSGGHKGVTSIINLLGTDQFPRLRIGIGKPEVPMPIPDYVLAKIPRQEWSLFQDVVNQCGNATEHWIISGIEHAMNLYNSRKE